MVYCNRLATGMGLKMDAIAEWRAHTRYDIWQRYVDDHLVEAALATVVERI